MRWNKYLTEFIGAFFLVATVGFTVLKPGDAGNLAPLAIGSALMVMIFAGGHISGAHYNPAVTLAVFLRGKCPAADVVPYMVAQVLGAVVAAAVVLFMMGNPSVEAANPDIPRALLAEFLYTFALCYVVLNVATLRVRRRGPHATRPVSRGGERLPRRDPRKSGAVDLSRTAARTRAPFPWPIRRPKSWPAK